MRFSEENQSPLEPFLSLVQNTDARLLMHVSVDCDNIDLSRVNYSASSNLAETNRNVTKIVCRKPMD